MTRVAIVVFTRDLRVSDHPALTRAAADASIVVPLFVFDDAILTGASSSANRTNFLLESLGDLDRALRALGSRLVVRRGSWAATVVSVARDARADAVHVSHDVSGHAHQRLTELREQAAPHGIEVHTHDGVTVVAPGAITPSGSDHYQVFSPYFRRWLDAPRRPVAPTPDALRLPDEIDPGTVPTLRELTADPCSPTLMVGGRDEAHRRLDEWSEAGLAGYGDHHDDLAGDATSRLSPYLHLGCVSPLEVMAVTGEHAHAGPFVRQLCWRDFFAQVLAARPDAAWNDYRPRGMRWRDDEHALDAWQRGVTGYPVVDAGMRQLATEGFMHNRARMIVASFLTKDLLVDWRAGARHFLRLLVDGDIANNNLNWQWVAGTGTDTNPHRIFNPTVQGKRFDPDGDYVRRHVPELAPLRGAATHDPDSAIRRACGYPEPIVEHHAAIAEYRAALGA
ncbi:MAG: deoxyribodipyrimidine photo-lyase [Acidimicrobiia bacterium]